MPELRILFRRWTNHGDNWDKGLSDDPMVKTNLVFLPPESFQVAPGYLVHGVRVAQIRRRLEVLSRCRRVLLHAPAVAEAVAQFEDREHQLAFGDPAFLHAGLQGLRLDCCGVGRCC